MTQIPQLETNDTKRTFRLEVLLEPTRAVLRTRHEGPRAPGAYPKSFTSDADVHERVLAQTTRCVLDVARRIEQGSGVHAKCDGKIHRHTPEEYSQKEKNAREGKEEARERNAAERGLG